MHKYFSIILLLSITLITSSITMAFTTSINPEEFHKMITGKEKQSIISNFKISNFTILTDKIHDISFINSKWNNILFNNKTFENISFNDCELTDLDFRNITLINVKFRNCQLKNVVMNNSIMRDVLFENSVLISTDPNIDNNYLELDVDKVIFKDSKLDHIGFYKSAGTFIFDGAVLNDVSGQSLKDGSSLYFNRTKAFDIDFSRSKLTTLEIKNSIIKESKANNCTIGNILLEDSKLDFSIGAGNGYDTVIAKNTGNVIIGASPVKNVKISGCPEDTRDIMVGGDKFDTIEIENCNADNITFFKSKGNYVSIKNANIYKLDFRLSKIDHLKLDNIHIKTTLYYDSSIIKKLEATNISFDENIEHTHENSNIEIKEDKKPTVVQ